MAKPWDPNEFGATGGPSGVQSWNDQEFSGFEEEEEEKPKKTLPKGSLMDQVHDIGSAATAGVDLITMLPGMVGGALSTLDRMSTPQEPKFLRDVRPQAPKKPAQEMLQDIGAGGEMTAASNWLGINENDPEYRNRTGYRAVMRPVEAITELFHKGGQGVEELAKRGMLGSERANPEVAKELGAGTEVSLLAGAPFIRGRAPRPGTPEAFREATQRPPQSPESFNAARETYPLPEEVKPFDAREFRDPIPTEFEPELRSSQLEGAEETILSEPSSVRSRPETELQDTMGLSPETLVQRQAMELGREQRGQVPIDELTGRGAREEVLPQRPTGPLEFERHDPNRIVEQLAAQEKPGFMRDALDIMRARELEQASRKPVEARMEDWNINEFTNGRLGIELEKRYGKELEHSFDIPDLQKRFNNLPEVKEYYKLLNEGKYKAIDERFAKTDIPANNSHYALTDISGVLQEPKYWLNENKNIFKDVRKAIEYLEQKNGIKAQPTRPYPKQGLVRRGLEIIQKTSTSPYYRELASKLLKDKTFNPNLELVARRGLPSLDHKTGKVRYNPGHYDPRSHTIRMADPYHGSEQLLLHEAIHASTFAALEVNKWKAKSDLKHFEKVNAAVDRLYELFDDLNKRAEIEKGFGSFESHPMSRIADKYGLTDIHEFVAEGFTNPAFQADLAQLKLPERLKSSGLKYYWDSFVDAIGRLLGFEGKQQTYLSELLRAGAEVISGVKSENRIYYSEMLDSSKPIGAEPLKEIKRRGGPVEALAEEAREMSLDNRPIEKVVEEIKHTGKIEDFTAEHTNKLWQVTARLGSLVKENLLMDTSTRQLMKDKPGTGPVVKWTVDQVARIERNVTKATKEAINTGLSDLRRMYHSTTMRGQLLDMWSKWQENIGVRDLTRADFKTEAQWKVYNNMRAVDDKILDRVNEMRTKAGLPAINRIPSHFRGMWEGDYRVFIYDGAGNKKAAYGFQTEWGAKKVAAEFRKKHPDMKVDYDHVKTDQYGIRNLQGFEDAIRIMSEKNDPVAKALQATYHEILKHRGFGRTGVHRKGVSGFLGSEGGILGLKRMEHAFEQHIEQAYRYIGNLEKQLVLAELQKVPKEMWDQMPETKGFLESYIRKTQGAKMGENWIDAAITRLSKAVGMGEHGPQTAMRALSSTAVLYWLTTPRFLFSQSVQSLNAIPKLVQRFGHIDTAKAYFTGVTRAVFPKMRDAASKEAVEWALQRGYLDATIHNLVEKDIFKDRPIGSFNDAAKEIITKPAQLVERHLVRTPVFLAFEEALRPYIKDRHSRFEEAAEYADYYMVNYSGSHSPMAYDKMGLLGQAAKPLKQYAHNTWGQFFEYARGVKNKGEIAPMGWFLGVQASVAGLKGMMVVAEATAIVTLLNYMFDLDIPTPEQLMLKWGLHDALIYGGLSTVLQHDVSASVSAPGIPNMFTAAPLQFGAKLVTDVGGYAVKLAKGEDTDQDRLKALLAITPNAFHEWIKGLYTAPGAPTANPYDANLRGNYRRSDDEWFWSQYVMSAKPLQEAKADAMMRAVKQELQRDMKQRLNALEAITDRVMNGQNVTPDLMERYIKQGGDPSQLARHITNKMKERMMTGPERMQDSKTVTPQQAHKLDTLQQYLDEIDRSIPDGYKFDDVTGEIKPISLDWSAQDKPEKDQFEGLPFPNLPTDKFYDITRKESQKGQQWMTPPNGPKGNPRKEKKEPQKKRTIHG